MKTHEIVGYTFNVENLHPGCLLASLPTGTGQKFDGWAPAPSVNATVEESLDELAFAFQIDRKREDTFDSAEFPKVIFAEHVQSDEMCGRCLHPLLD